MDVLLSRILKYLNGALVYDDSYKLCTYIVDHYLEMESMTKERVLEETGIDEKNMDDFIGLPSDLCPAPPYPLRSDSRADDRTEG